MAKAKQVVKGKVIKKEWYPVNATKAFDSAPLGESYVADPQELLNRSLTVNLANLTGDVKQQNINLTFRITEVTDKTGVATITGYETAGSQLKRLVRRGVERFDDTITCTTKDEKQVVIKPFAVTRNKTSKEKIHLLRRLMKQTITAEVGKLTYDDLLKAVISNNIQGNLKKPLRKLYPLKALEIRKLELVEAA